MPRTRRWRCLGLPSLNRRARKGVLGLGQAGDSAVDHIQALVYRLHLPSQLSHFCGQLGQRNFITHKIFLYQHWECEIKRSSTKGHKVTQRIKK